MAIQQQWNAAAMPREQALAGIWQRALVLVGMAIVLCLGALAAAPDADAAPEITLDKQAPSSVLFGDDSQVTLRAVNPTGQPYGYNLSFRDVLPEGVSYVAVPGGIEPRIITDAPETGKTTLIFENVSDLSPGSSYELSYGVSHDTGLFLIGDSYTNEASAHINDDPHFVPDFDANGEPGGDITGEAEDSASTEISALEIVKDEKSTEGELLRGVHDHQTVYTLTVRNNAIEETTDLVVEDFLPAGLEFLGCGEADNTTDAPTNPEPGSPLEYPGAEPINPGNAPPAPDCKQPDLVETVETDPDGAGSMLEAVYTRVVWNTLGKVEAKDEIPIQYVAAIPIRENTLEWNELEGEPTPASLEQGSNLDNNSGPETFEDHEEHGLTNFTRVKGDYEGTEPVEDVDTLTRIAEDLVVHKRVDKTTINQGQISTWSLDIATSEYRYVEDIRVNDTLPDGLCPLGSENFEEISKQSGECAVTGDEPNREYTSVTESPEGGFELLWDETKTPELAEMGPSQSFTIHFPTKTRAFYQENFENDEAKPVLAEDSWENRVEIAGADYRICAPSDPLCTGGQPKIDGQEVDAEDDFDLSAASQEAGGIKIDKQIGAAATPMDCATAEYGHTIPGFGPGDTVCWLLRIDFASQLETGKPRLTDFLPPGAIYVPESAVPTPGVNEVPSTFDDTAAAAEGVLTWDLGNDVESGGLVFEWRFATKVDQDVTDAVGDLKGNLMKLSFENTAGTTFPLRKEAEYSRSQALLDLDKRVADVDDLAPTGVDANGDGAIVAEGDVVTFKVAVENKGNLAAADTVVWDELEDGITCTDVPIVNDGGECVGSRIVWDEISIAAGVTKDLTYDVKMPEGIEPGRSFNDHAGVVSYTGTTNTEETFTYVPDENIDPDAPEANVPAANDVSSVRTRALSFHKTRTTAIDEAGNGPTTEATIGEQIDYKATLVIPEGTTVYAAEFRDYPGAPRHSELLGVDVKLNNAALPGGPGFEILADPAPGLIVRFPGAYSSGEGDDTFHFTISTRVGDDVANSRVSPHHVLTNTATFHWEDEDGTEHKPEASVNTTIVEPNIAVAKTDDDADKKVSAGEEVEYTITASNVAGDRVSTAHDLVLVDEVPEGLEPVLPLATGVWDEGERTITWQIESLGPGEQTQRSYKAKVQSPATAGEEFTNFVDLTATSMAGTAEGERAPGSPVETGYVADAEDTLQLGDATLEKTANPTEATIGQKVTYTTEVFFPGNVDYFDTMVIDRLPDGLTYDATTGVTCNSGSCEPIVTPLPAEIHAGGESTVAWFLGDFESEPTGRTVEITYTAHVDEEYVPPAPVSDGQALSNVAEAAYNGSDQLGAPPATIPATSEFTGTSNSDEAKVDVVEPEVVIDKTVSGDADEDDLRSTEPGDSYTYELTVRNTGSSPAYDVEVTDSWDPTQLTNVTVLTTSGATDQDGSDGDLEWVLPGPIASNGTVVLEYEADLAPSADLSDGETIPNTAVVPLYWGLSEVERDENPTWDYREYEEAPEDSVTLDVHLPQLQVTKTPDAAEVPASTAEVGEPFSWHVVVENNSTVATAHAVELRDVLPANWEYVDGTATFSPGGVVDPTDVLSAPSGDTLVWENIGDLAPGASIALDFEAEPTVAAIDDPGSGAANPNVNRAAATATDSSDAGSSAEGPYEAEDQGEGILTLPELVVEKTPDEADASVVKAGNETTYSVKVSNEGDVPAREVVITDVLGPGQTYTAGDAEATPETGFSEESVNVNAGTGETTIEWEIVEIPAGGSVTILVPVKTDPGLADGSDLLNVASVVSREITSPKVDGGEHEVEVDSDVGIEKKAQTEAVDAGEEMDFTLTVTNHGPSDATGVTITDDLPANLEFVSATGCSEASSVVTCAIGNLDPGQSVERTLRVKVDPDETEKVVNKAEVSSTSNDSEPDNDESTAEKTVGVEANVLVEKEGPSAPVLQWTDFEYTLKVSNLGVSAATNVTLDDDLPEAVEFKEMTGDVGGCSEVDDTIECSFGTLEPTEVRTVTVLVKAVGVGPTSNTAMVDTDSNETTETDNEDTADVELAPMADLAVTKSASATVAAGGELTYLLEVVNNGPSPANGVTLGTRCRKACSSSRPTRPAARRAARSPARSGNSKSTRRRATK